jgi:hypothetical protein
MASTTGAFDGLTWQSLGLKGARAAAAVGSGSGPA